MHEWALAEAVLETVRTQQTARSGQRAAKVVIRFGELQSIDPDVFGEGIRQLRSGDDDPDLEFVFETEPATLKCKVCGHGWSFADSDIDEPTREAIHFLPEVAHSFIVCPSCGSADFRVDRGRGVTIESIEFVPRTAADETPAGAAGRGSDD
ncbi:MAG: hydrogenase nickel incorporation protein HypA [Spirochaetia bacterium]